MTLTRLVQPTPLTTSVDDDGASTIVSLRGEADVFTLPALLDVLTRVIADRNGPVVVDLADCGFIDTATVRALARTWRFLDDRGRAMAVRSPSRIAVLLLDLFGLAHIVEPGRTAAA